MIKRLWCSLRGHDICSHIEEQPPEHTHDSCLRCGRVWNVFVPDEWRDDPYAQLFARVYGWGSANEMLNVPTQCPHELYLRVTDSTGKSRIDWVLVWNAEKFLASSAKTWEKEGLRVEIATREDYLKQIRRPNG